MKRSGFSLGALGLAQLLSSDGLLGESDPQSFTGKSPIRRALTPIIHTRQEMPILNHQLNKS